MPFSTTELQGLSTLLKNNFGCPFKKHINKLIAKYKCHTFQNWSKQKVIFCFQNSTSIAYQQHLPLWKSSRQPPTPQSAEGGGGGGGGGSDSIHSHPPTAVIRLPLVKWFFSMDTAVGSGWGRQGLFWRAVDEWSFELVLCSSSYALRGVKTHNPNMGGVVAHRCKL